MTRVTFVRDGRTSVVEASAGARLLDVAQADGQPLEGTCGGDMACATCHVIVDPVDYAALPPPSAEEEDMLDLVTDSRATSRLACQVRLNGTAELRVMVPD